MKRYSDYTQKELDELYANLSPVAQDFVYSDIIKEEVASIGKETGLHIDKWEALDTLVLETVLGIVPASMFQSELQYRLGVSGDTTAAIVAHMDTEIFSVIRDESVSGYEDSNNKNIAGASAGAIYDNSQESISTDPYRENVGGGHNNAPVITAEKLHLVDELFAAHGPKIKELTPADGSVRIPTEDSKHVPDLFEKSSSIPLSQSFSPSLSVITKASLEAEDAADALHQRQGQNFAGASQLETLLKTLPPLENILVSEVKTTATIDTPAKEVAPSMLETSNGTVSVHIEKSATPGRIKLHISKSKIVSPILLSTKTRPQSDADGTTGHKLGQVHYEVDPYKEIL